MKELPLRCENCWHYEFEEDADGTRYHYCRLYDCQLCEILGLDPANGCEKYDQMPLWGEEER